MNIVNIHKKRKKREKKTHEHCPETGLHTLYKIRNIYNLMHRLMSYFRKSITGKVTFSN